MDALDSLEAGAGTAPSATIELCAREMAGVNGHPAADGTIGVRTRT